MFFGFSTVSGWIYRGLQDIEATFLIVAPGTAVAVTTAIDGLRIAVVLLVRCLSLEPKSSVFLFQKPLNNTP